AAGAALPGADVPALAADDLRFGHVWLERLMAAAVAGGPFCLQLDDLHELGQGSAAEQLLAVAARAAPAGFHLVVTTRRPPGPPWARLLAEGMAVHVGVDDLVLDPAEAAALVVAEGARGWTPRALIAASRGWML